MNDFLIGQRVIYSDKEIVTITIGPERKYRRLDAELWDQWVIRANGVEQCVSKSNLKPLPGGQL